MSDGTTLNTGSGGDTVATEQIAQDRDGYKTVSAPAATVGQKVQLVKVMLGEHGTDGGTVTPSNPMPVSDKALLEAVLELTAEVRRMNEILERGL